MGGIPRPVTDRRSWAARAGILPWYGGGAAFSPLDIPGLALWLDASDLSTITHSSGAVSQWDDKSGNGKHATQGTAAAQPITGTRTINGLNVLKLDGNDDNMFGALTVPAGTVMTYFMVVKVDGGTQYGLNATDSATRFAGFCQSGSSSDPLGTGTTASGYKKNNQAFAGTTRGDLFTFVGTSPIIFRTEGLSYDTGATNWALSYNANLFRTNGVFGEHIAYTGVLSADNIAKVENWLAAKWGVTLA